MRMELKACFQENNSFKFRSSCFLQNRPNPFDESTMIGFIVHDRPQSDKALITITDTQGQMAQQMTTSIKMGVNEILYDHGYGKVGTYFYNLIIDGKTIDTKKMVFVAF